MNISQMFRNFDSSNLQQLQSSRQVNQQSGQSRIQSQNQNQNQNQTQRDQYIPQGNMTQESAGIYSPSGTTQAQINTMPRDASGQFVERDNEAVSFNPYTFNPQAMNEARPQEAPNQSERPEGMPENGEFSGEMPDLPPIPEDEEFSGELRQDLPEGNLPPARPEESDSESKLGSVPPAKPEDEESDSESESESESINTMAQRPGGMRGPGRSGGPAPVSGSEEDSETDSDSSNDSELEKLEQERTKLTQKLNTERDDSKKASLRVELQSVESQIVQLKAQLN